MNENETSCDAAWYPLVNSGTIIFRKKKMNTHLGPATMGNIVKGTPEKPLFEQEDILAWQIVKISRAAANLWVTIGMTGLEAVGEMVKRP